MKRTIRIPLVFIIILIIAIVLCIKSFATTTNGIITEITVNMREKPSTTSKVIMYVTQDDKVEVLEKTGDWYKIKYKNKTGYVSANFVKVDKEVKNTNQEQNKIDSEKPVEEVTETIEAKLQIVQNTEVRIVPNVTSSIIYTATADTAIELLEQMNGWSYIKVSNICGWVRTENLKEVTKETPTTVEEKEEDNTKLKNEIAYVKYDSTNLRKEPSTDAAIVEKLKMNTEVTIIEDVDAIWYKVKVKENTGYISKDLLTKEKQKENQVEETQTNTTTSRDGGTTQREEPTVIGSTTEKKEEPKKDTNITNNSSKENEIVAYAKQYLGYAYVYGGSSPKTGFDCSGFTSYVYKHFGYNLSRSSVGQASNGTKVSKEELKPGDLVIYKNTSLTKIGHVGIYIGDNKMIHASEPGVGVTITDIDSKAHKYPQRFVMGRRIIK